MEPEGPLTPGSSYGPPSLDSAQSILSCTLQSSHHPEETDALTSAGSSWDQVGGEGSVQGEVTEVSTDLGRSVLGGFRSSAFPSSLNWDSDSEKETLDEEELQHLSNPHGLAAHSPGSPSSGLRRDNEDDPERQNVQLLHGELTVCHPGGGHRDNNSESTKTGESAGAQLGQVESADAKIWNVSEGAELFLPKVKPKGDCQMEEREVDNSVGDEGEGRPSGRETKECDTDVYTFPGDSDPESPPPAPWAHCTFVQRCRTKRVLLRPFSGLGSSNSTLADDGQETGAALNEDGTVFDFDADVLRKEATEEQIEFRGDREEEVEEESAAGAVQEIFTCVECSIYFNKQLHLQEHMVEHSQRGPGGGGGGGGHVEEASHFQCVECGWELPDEEALSEHHRRHEESRLKILEEIQKLNENEKPTEPQKTDVGLEGGVKSDSNVSTQDSSQVLTPGEETVPETVPPPPLSPLQAVKTTVVPAVVFSDSTSPNSVRPSVHGRAGFSYRRRFACTKCSFNGKTSQALANHSKVHNRNKTTPPTDPTHPTASASEAALREHQKRSHPGPSPGGRSLTSFEDGVGPEQEVTNRRRRRRTAQLQESNATPGPGPAQVSSDSDHPGHCTSITLESDKQSSSMWRSVKENHSPEVEDDGKVLRRSTRVSTAAAEPDGDDDGEAAEQSFLVEEISDEDNDVNDEEAKALKSVERKCPYCPDRFHNGIGLANHVRGHLNRVGVSYNVRHFISPEEVKAIERKFSYQKKKKKGQRSLRVI
ncbi:uncharacterized protein LOC103393718 [Cynoglossus semilaevis]|uniref:uncharacterized protein LOC103393718 n=1 Tax=Cynoglossus semilaevis TaxID=244447 RepID=UPI000D62BEED|nr:uncharacterized protein LOC103393718 [Cynoglossus semilaevis]